MALIDRIGRFRGVPTQGIMGESTGGFPQFVVQFLATEYYDAEKNLWIDWTPFQQTMKAYLILFNASKALLNYEQVMKAFNWDGADLAALQSEDFGDLIVQFEVKENLYNGKINLRIEWIDSADANPLSGGGGNLTPMDTGKLKALSAKYGQFMKVAAKIAPVRGGSLPAPVAVAPPALPPVLPLPGIPAPSVPVAVDGHENTGIIEGITQQAAWAGLNEVNDTLATEARKSEDDLATLFLASSEEIANASGRSEDDLSEMDWANVLSNATNGLTV